METPQADIDQLFSRIEREQTIPTAIVRKYTPSTAPEDLHGLSMHSGLQLQAEKPEHRIVLWMKAQGYSNREIAAATGYTPTHIGTITAQPWFRKKVAEIINSEGRDAVKVMLQGEVMPSIELLRTVRDDPTAKKSDRVTAAKDLLDRFLGKPTVHVETNNTSKVTSISADRARLEEEARQNEAALRARGISIVPSQS